MELVLKVAVHAVAHPVDRLAEQETLEEVDDHLHIFLADVLVTAKLLEIAPYDLVTYPHEIMNEDLLTVGVK